MTRALFRPNIAPQMGQAGEQTRPLAKPGLRKSWPVLRWAWPIGIVILLLFWNSGRELYRANSSAIQKQLSDNPTAFLHSPWQLMRMYVSRTSDEKLYYAYTELARGRSVSESDVAERRAVTVDELRIRPGDGWRLPHRDFSVEYPPLLWAAILPPALVSDSLQGYRLNFGLWIAFATLATLVLAWRLRRHSEPDVHFSATAKTGFFLLLALGPILVLRFDIFPAFLTLLAAERAVARRPLHAGLALGAGAACKVYPLFLVPIFVAAWLGSDDVPPSKQVRAFGLGLALSLAIMVGPFLLLAPAGFLSDMAGHAARPLEVESVLGTPFLLLKSAYTFHAYGCINLGANGTATAARLSGWLFLAALAGVAAATYRAAKLSFATAVLNGCVLTLLAFFCTGKVLSPQYLIWIVPFLCAQHGRRPFWLAAGIWVAMALAQIWYSALWQQIVQLRSLGPVLLVVRNTILGILFGSYLIAVIRRSPSPAPMGVKRCQPRVAQEDDCSAFALSVAPAREMARNRLTPMPLAPP